MQSVDPGIKESLSKVVKAMEAGDPEKTRSEAGRRRTSGRRRQAVRTRQAIRRRRH